ncbi:MAG: HAMP domain-containing protein [Gemmatimonadales bacterium]|nr:MAG: HAMP domain-containing protein [Gemmatimonadales bacterium]
MPARTLATRIALPAGLFTLASVGALSWALIRSQRTNALEEAALGSESIGEAILLAIEHEMRVNERYAIREVLRNLGGHEGIESIRLFNKQGWISFSSDSSEVGRKVDMEAEACVNCHEGPTPAVVLDTEDRARTYRNAMGQSVVGTIQVIQNKPGCQGGGCHPAVEAMPILGVLDVVMSLEAAEARIAMTGWRALIYSLLAAGMITGVLFLIITRSIHRPLRTVAQATQRVTKGVPHVAAPRGSAPEIRILADSVNEVVENLSSSRSQLEAWAGRLEHIVAEKAKELSEARFQIVQAEKLSSVGLVAAGIAHELNSPLMAIITYSHLVRKHLPEESTAHEDVRMIEREANRCAGIIRQLLDYARDQRRNEEVERCSLSEAVYGALELLKIDLQNGGISLHVAVPDDLPPVGGNDVQLMQIFVNLFMNALHAMPEGGKLHIEAGTVERAEIRVVDLPPHPATRFVTVRVRDTGTGIEPEALPKVFDPFFTTKPVGKGSGLGLSVSLGIVRKYGGTILVESRHGQGATFTVILPEHIEPSEG